MEDSRQQSRHAHQDKVREAAPALSLEMRNDEKKRGEFGDEDDSSQRQ